MLCGVFRWSFPLARSAKIVAALSMMRHGSAAVFAHIFFCNFSDNFIFGSNTTFSRTIPASSRSALDSEREAALRRSAELRWQNFREGGDLNIQIHTAETQQGYAKWSMKWPPYDGPAFACI